jgi:hypothetical protein
LSPESKTTGDSKGRTVHEFFAQIDTYAKVSNWSEDEKALIAKAKLQGIALQYVQRREVLSDDACPYAVLRENLTDRFSEKLPTQYHYTRLQDATQERGESVEEFADRLDAYARGLYVKSMMKPHRE